MTRKIPLTGKYGQGKYALVSEEDYEELAQYKWRVGTHGYAMRAKWNPEKGNNDCVLMHREIAKPSKGLMVDHVDMDKLNNTRGNLRVVNKSQNTTNALSRKGSSSMYKGVTYNKRSGKWAVELTKDYVKHYVGLFSDEVEAARACDTKAVELFGDYARLNFGGEEIAHSSI